MTQRLLYAIIMTSALTGACSNDSSTSGPDAAVGPDAASAPDGPTSACASEATQQGRVACAANAVLASGGVSTLALDDYVDMSKWNNLPVQLKPRAGVQMGTLSAATQAKVLELMDLALDGLGDDTMTGILRADDYLATMAGGYGSDLYSIAIYGTPSATGDFVVMFGGHHMAYNLHFVGGGFYPVPQHLGAEPKASFTFDGGTYNPMGPKGDAMFAIYTALDASQRTAAYLSGQTFNDVVVSPDLDYGKGAARTSPSAYPTGTNRKGVLVSSMTPAQQAAVVAAIEEWVRQYPAEVADPLMTDYTASAALADTYFAWGGASSGPSEDVSKSYLRLDGPRLWIELAVQGGIVIQSQTHYHSVYRDKQLDYGGAF